MTVAVTRKGERIRSVPSLNHGTHISHRSSEYDEDDEDAEDSRRGPDSHQDVDSDKDRDKRGAGSMSNYEYTKPWGGTGGFMDSYGIDRTPGGYQEANDMVDQMRETAEAADRDGGGDRKEK